MSKTLSNLFSNIQNGQRKRILVIRQPHGVSKLVQGVLQVMQENGYLRGFRQSYQTASSPRPCGPRSMRSGTHGSLFQMRKSQGKEEPIKNLGIDILLKYKNQQPIINKINMISKPSQKVYNKLEDIQNLVHPTSPSRIGGGGKGHSPIQGLWILSTSRGILSHVQAYHQGVGGELICHIT